MCACCVPLVKCVSLVPVYALIWAMPLCVQISSVKFVVELCPLFISVLIFSYSSQVQFLFLAMNSELLTVRVYSQQISELEEKCQTHFFMYPYRPVQLQLDNWLSMFGQCSVEIT
jgi:hypothetical protein